MQHSCHHRELFPALIPNNMDSVAQEAVEVSVCRRWSLILSMIGLA